MKRSYSVLILLIGILTLLPAGVAAQQEMSPKALEIANELNCPICEGQSVRDSNSQLARDMRDRIQIMLDEGHSEQEIKDYFVDRYGVGILREPPKDGFFMTLWWMPVIGVAIGALVLGTFVTQRKSRATKGSPGESSTGPHSDPGADSDDDLSEYEDRVLRDLSDEDANWNRQ